VTGLSYAILVNPGHNRVYFNSTFEMSSAELEIAMGDTVSGIRRHMIAGVPYIVFDTEGELSGEMTAVLSRLSFTYALFQISGDYSTLYPILIEDDAFFDSGISTILKYTGKTNEIFTRMMINLALFSSDFHHEKQIRLLDPVAGKGTTLFEGLRLGYDVSGIEIGGKAVQETATYFKKYLETEKYKHSYEKEKRSGPGKSYTAKVHSFLFAKTKLDFKESRNTGSLCLVEGNSMNADRFLKNNHYHYIVGDLPYGVAHGNVTNERQSSLTRNPAELLNACLPAWCNLLMPGGAITLAWNVHVLPKTKITHILEEYGFFVKTGGAYDRLEHRVDRSILRDVIVAVKK